MRYHNYKFLFNLRGDNGAPTGGLAVDTNLGWKGPEKYVATVPQVIDLWADPQERYDIFMNNFTERTWLGPVMGQELKRIAKTFLKYPPRKLQSDGYTGPITISQYERFENIKNSSRNKTSTSAAGISPTVRAVKPADVARHRKRIRDAANVASVLWLTWAVFPNRPVNLRATLAEAVLHGSAYASHQNRSLAAASKRSLKCAMASPSLMRLPELNFNDDKDGKPIGINQHIGRRPIAAFGNSEGDREMLEYTQGGSGSRFMLLVLHDDPAREYAYGPALGLPHAEDGCISPVTLCPGEEGRLDRHQHEERLETDLPLREIVIRQPTNSPTNRRKEPTMKLTTKNLTHSLLKGAMACAVALAGGHALAADAKPNAIMAIDILLEPDATMIQHATATNERLRKVFPKGFALDASHRPHITLVQRFVLTENLDKVYAAVGKVFATANVTGLKLEAFKYYYIPDKDLGLSGIVIKPTPELLKLEQQVIDAVTPFTVKTGTSAAFVTDADVPEVLPTLITYVSEFVPKHSGEHYHPHVTTGLAPQEYLDKMLAEPFEAFTFSPAGAAVYHLGQPRLDCDKACR